jgi:hypothetical protein
MFYLATTKPTPGMNEGCIASLAENVCEAPEANFTSMQGSLASPSPGSRNAPTILEGRRPALMKQRDSALSRRGTFLVGFLRVDWVLRVPSVLCVDA